MRSTLILLLLLLALPTQARMYQWDNPDTGRTHLSGKPPAWYRTGTEGPRVFVFDSGQLVDDTGVAVSDDKRRALRRQALAEAAENTEQARHHGEQPTRLQQSVGKLDAPPGPPPALAIPDAPAMPPPVTENLDADEDSGLTAEEVAEMRALVSEWESRNRAANQRRVERLNDGDAGDGTAESAGSTPSVTREQVLEYHESRQHESKAQDD